MNSESPHTQSNPKPQFSLDNLRSRALEARRPILMLERIVPLNIDGRMG